MQSKPPEMAQEVYEGVVVARRLRQELGLKSDAPVDCMLRLAERRLAVEVILAELADGLSGFYLPVMPSPLVIVQQHHPVQRQRFTVAHELGHHALGHAAAPRIHGEAATTGPEPQPGLSADAEQAPANAAHYRPQRAPNAEERAANAFAGELLCPDVGASVVLASSIGEAVLDRAVRLSSHFGISAFSAIVKLEMLGEIDRDERRALGKRLAAGEHLPRYEQLGLDALDDELQRHADAGGGPRCSPAARSVLAMLRAESDAGTLWA